MATTTIKVREETKMQLDKFRQYENESYDEVIRKVIFIARTSEDDLPLSRQTIKDIEKARKQIKEGKYYSLEEVKDRLGLSDGKGKNR